MKDTEVSTVLSVFPFQSRNGTCLQAETPQFILHAQPEELDLCDMKGLQFAFCSRSVCYRTKNKWSKLTECQTLTSICHYLPLPVTAPQMRKVLRVWPSFCFLRCANWGSSCGTAACVNDACRNVVGWQRKNAVGQNAKLKSYDMTGYSWRGLFRSLVLQSSHTALQLSGCDMLSETMTNQKDEALREITN